mgnify:CR=1 FL=1
MKEQAPIIAFDIGVHTTQATMCYNHYVAQKMHVMRIANSYGVCAISTYDLPSFRKALSDIIFACEVTLRELDNVQE